MSKSTKWHVFFWTCYFFYAYVTDLAFDDSGYTTFVKEIVFFLTANIYLFYTLYYCINKFSAKSGNQILKSLGRFVIVLSIFFLTRHFIRYLIISGYFGDKNVELPIDQWFVSSILWIGNYILFASGYFYFQSSIQKQKALTQVIEEKLTREKEIIQLENIALRAQINPHFLYNTLGFLYAEALPHSDKLSEGIVRLSEIMQYSIKPHDASGMVLLEDEIEHIENVLEINKLRFGQSIYVQFTYEGQRSGVRIVPLVLLTLVENVLKHGQLNDPEYPATIHLKLDGTKLTFTTHNKKRSGPKEHSTSIGLNNTRKRLQNAYGQNFSLTSKEEGDYFSATLVIDNVMHTVMRGVAQPYEGS